MSGIVSSGRTRRSPKAAGGFTLIEILVTILVLALGLQGVMSMQTRAAATEFESYQRGQALALARDMQSRLLSSRGLLTAYLDASISSTDGSAFFGNGSDAINYANADGVCAAPLAGDALSQAKHQACSWGSDLRGVAEKEGANAVGAMVGARGCVIRVNPPSSNALADFYVVIVWQGIVERAEPAANSPAGQCASGVNFGTGLRRGVSFRVLVPDLQKAT